MLNPISIEHNCGKYLQIPFSNIFVFTETAHTLPIIPETDLILIHICYVFKSTEIYKNLFQFKYFSH